MLKQESIKLEINVPVRMRDGTILYADIFRPDTGAKCPAIITRIPYNKSLMLPMASGYMNPQRFTREGYATIIQDCRGTGVSEGKKRLWEHESEDGYDTVEWTAAQPWCDGNVGMYGASYFGYTQWMTAAAQPPHLKTICPAEAAPTARDYPVDKGNVFGLQGHLSWYLRMCMLSLIGTTLPPVEATMMLGKLTYMLDNIEEQCKYLPLTESPAAKIGEQLGMEPSLSEFIINIKNDNYWEQLNSIASFEDITVPVFHLSGWYDQFCSNVLASYVGMKVRGGSDFARKNQKLLMGPWFHGLALPSNVGSLDFGLASAGPSIDVTGMHIKWFDYWLKGIDNGIMNEPPIRIFVMGDNIWRNVKEWPPAETIYARYHFHSNGQANSRYGNGVLSAELPSEEPDDVYLYNPMNPVPYKWDIPSSGYATFAVQEQEEVEKRADVLVYTSAPLEKDLEVTGTVEIKLWAISSVMDTDFTSKLVDVWPDGRAYNLTDGIVRARYRNSSEEPEFIEPGKIYEYSIKLHPTSNVFKMGHRIRVQISSSNFPKWDRNLNTGHPIGQDAEIEVAVQTVLHNMQYPSHIILPVIPK